MHDGTSLDNRISDDVEEDDSTMMVKQLFRSIIWIFNLRQMSIALINRIEFQDSKIFTLVIQGSHLESSATHSKFSMLQYQIKAFQDKIGPDAINANPELFSDELKILSDQISDKINTEHYALSVCAVSKMLKEKSCNIYMASAFIFHAAVLMHIPLSQRRLPSVTFDERFEMQINEFLNKISQILRNTIDSLQWCEMMTDNKINLDAVDLLDGRLLRVIAQMMHAKSLDLLDLKTKSEALITDWEQIADLVALLTDQELSLEDVDGPEYAAREKIECKKENTSYGVLPFSNKIFDRHLECVHVNSDASLSTLHSENKVYRETSHWHNRSKPLNPKIVPVAKVSKWKDPLRINQFYMKEMYSYAASLTGTKGNALEPEIVTVNSEKIVKNKKAEHESSGKGSHPKKGANKGTSSLSKSEKIIAGNKERKDGKNAEKALSAWKTFMESLNAISDIQDRYKKTRDYLNGLDESKTTYLEWDINIYTIQSLLNWWIKFCKSEKKLAGFHVIALIWTTVRTICNLNSPAPQQAEQIMIKVCKILGITDALIGFQPNTSTSKLSFSFKFPTDIKNLDIGMSQKDFQLMHCGPYMDRMLDAKPDPRVPNFVPDGWQRKVLDQLDANKSIFVVAPTSAGKTFISFYAMEQVLRADNDGILVYVAPTKALVNQIAAEIQGRFKKRYPVAGKSVWAIHTRDYRINNPTSCQILVTVPHILQIMLLSPSNAKTWAPRVRKIIFDEIHSIGQAEDGVVWEQLLLLAPCPIIALSATVGNPKEFNEWLSETQKSHGSDLRMIEHTTRYSDLRKYIYTPPKTFKFSGLGKSLGLGLGLDGLEGISAFHPVASLVYKTRGMPDDLALEPRDCLTLWKAMCEFQTVSHPVPASLNPEKALPACIRKKNIFDWEKELKVILWEWMQDKNSPFDKVVQSLSQAEKTYTSEILPVSITSSTAGEKIIDPSDLKATTLPLIYQLHQKRALPVIFFNYDRSKCEQIAYAILDQLIEAESIWKNSSAWKKMIEGYEKWKEQKLKKPKRPLKPTKKTKADDDEGASKLDRMRDESGDGASIYDLFDPDAPQEGFTFANHKQLPKSELEQHVEALEWKNISAGLINLLKRGIGVHHSGMNRKYRQCVEILFRRGFLRVIIATGTLSLGINMPCATVVFSGDSPYLTALNFRQAAGRSGRRGFDLLGNVVFQGLSKERTCVLLSSRLPEIIGHFPITTTLVLRLFTLLHGSSNSKFAEQSINSLLSQPRLYLGGQSFKEQVMHHLRFSIDYLRRNELLGSSGTPLNFTSCVSHLYYTENSSFAFHALLRGGYFQKICANGKNDDDTLLEMMLTLSHIFGRQACRRLDDPIQAEIIKKSPSIVYLPEMPEEAAEILRKHNRDTLEIFISYVKSFSAQHFMEENRLPVSRIPIGRVHSMSEEKLSKNMDHKNYGEAETGLSFIPSLPTPKARSSFFAVSGLGDDFKNIQDLCSSVRDGIFLESAAIPHLEIYPDEISTPLNAYLLDFYKHGALDPLELANGIRKADVWFRLNDFSMVLATIVTSLGNYLGVNTEGESDILNVMGSGDAAENENDEKIAESSVIEPSLIGTNNLTAVPQQRFVPKKKVVDNWNAGEDALVAEEEYLKSEEAKGLNETDEEEFQKLMAVYNKFKKLSLEFNTKFRKIWA
ncbi:putative helicase [Podosphaera aphanis]|nr:putative helicase [Podosphaera aphanis]